MQKLDRVPAPKQSKMLRVYHKYQKSKDSAAVQEPKGSDSEGAPVNNPYNSSH